MDPPRPLRCSSSSPSAWRARSRARTSPSIASTPTPRARRRSAPHAGPGRRAGAVPANGMTFRAPRRWPREPGPAVILLHGFPQTSAIREPLIAPPPHRATAFLPSTGAATVRRPPGRRRRLRGARAGRRHDRGRPRRRVRALPPRRPRLGLVIGWVTAIRRPGRVLTWSGLSIPRPGAFAEHIARDPTTYIRDQHGAARARDAPHVQRRWRACAGSTRAPRRRNATSTSRVLEPGALTAALDWYRAIGDSLGSGETASGPVSTPTLFVFTGAGGLS